MQFRHLKAMAKWFKELVGQLKPRRPQDRPQMGVRNGSTFNITGYHRVVPKWTLMKFDEQWWTLFCLNQIHPNSMVVTCTLSSASPQIQLGFNISNSFSSARSSPSRLVRGQRSKTGSGPSATFLPRISLTWVVYGGLWWFDRGFKWL